MKAKQIALTLMFFVCFALFFTGCKTMSYSKSWTRTSSLKFNLPKPDKIPATTQGDTNGGKTDGGDTNGGKTDEGDTDGGKTDGNGIKEIIKTVTTKTVEEHNIKVSVDPRSTPLTVDIVNNIKKAVLNFRELDYSLSKSLSMTIIERKNAPKKYEISEGVLKSPQEQNITSVRIDLTPEHKGTLKDMDPSSETFVIVFTSDEDEIPLTFKRNSQGRYDLVSAIIDTERRTDFVIEADPPQLCILSELNEHLETLAIFNSNQTVSQSWQSYEKPAYQKIPAGGSSRQFSPSRRIDDTQSSVTKTGITNYVKDKNRYVDSATLSKLIDTYISEAEIEGINLDIAIAQMLYTTKYLDSKNQQMKNHNYGGLSEQTPGWNGKFPKHLSDGMTEGVRAHIQHLKGYVSTRRPVPCVDPRYDILVEKGYWGQVKTFDELFRAWSPNSPSYGTEINRILKGLSRSSGNY